jgi:hypothetical protein
MDVSTSLIRVFRHPDEHLLAEGARSGPRQDVKGIEDLDGIAPRWATTGRADQTTNFEGSPVTNADRRSVNMIWAGGEGSSARSRLDCRKSSRFETRSAGGTSQRSDSIAGWPAGSFLALRLVWITASCRIRLLMASGELPPGGSLADKILPGQAVRVTRVIIGRSMWGPCLICGEADPTVSYTYADRKVVRLHAACDALWRLERDEG